MRFGVRKLITGLAALVVLTAGAFTAYGASTVSNSSDYSKECGRRRFGCRTGNFRVSLQLSAVGDYLEQGCGGLEAGENSIGYLTITAEGREFENSYSSSKCSVSGADFRSAKADEDDPSVLEVTIRYTPVVRLGMTEKAGLEQREQNARHLG